MTSHLNQYTQSCIMSFENGMHMLLQASHVVDTSTNQHTYCSLRKCEAPVCVFGYFPQSDMYSSCRYEGHEIEFTPNSDRHIVCDFYSFICGEILKSGNSEAAID